MPDSCIFCKIISGEIPGKFVYQDEQVVVLEDINPQAPDHLLIVPRKHAFYRSGDTQFGELSNSQSDHHNRH